MSGKKDVQNESESDELTASALLAVTQQRLENLNRYYGDPNLSGSTKREIFDKIQEVTRQLKEYTARFGHLVKRPVTMEIKGDGGTLFQRTFVPHGEAALPAPKKKGPRRSKPKA